MGKHRIKQERPVPAGALPTKRGKALDLANLIIGLLDLSRWLLSLFGGPKLIEVITTQMAVVPAMILFWICMGILLKRKWHKIRWPFLRFSILLVLSIGFGFQMGWTRVLGLFFTREGTVDCNYPESIYLSEGDALRYMNKVVGKNVDQEANRVLAYTSETSLRNDLSYSVRHGALKMKWKRKGGDWRYALPPDSADLIFEIEKHSPGISSEQKDLFERMYWKPDICANKWWGN